ncbi:MAG: CDP-diacylglycerol--serine O-phosphatidyltransferase [Legionellales bacterium]|nr:CDP-diacylglycerol--serine O-phosphatidyltransferase [Legionellales bacterium]|tara:strand:- start:6417 stop:7175 length:759 start_codon:yes stop_codon:yes gene_type:complete
MSEELNPRQRGRRGIYLLPNLFTTAGLFAGFYSVVAAMKGYFDLAALTVFIAMIMDGLDGRVARLTNTESAFGMEYDSLADIVSFGLAPALVVYSWALHYLGKPGWLAAFLFAASGALRLARFNTQASNDKRFFQGLPIPAAAGMIASMVWIGHEFELLSTATAVIAAIITIGAGLLMVSNVRYYSFKEFDLKGKVPFIAIIIVVLLFICIAINPPTMLFLAFFIYGLSGPILTLRGLHKKRRAGRDKNNTI